MIIEGLLATARRRLITVNDDAPLIAAAAHLRDHDALVVVCDTAGALAGVITKTDIVRLRGR